MQLKQGNISRPAPLAECSALHLDTFKTRRLTAFGDSCARECAATGSVGVPADCMASWACSQLCSPAFAAAAAAEDGDGAAVGAWLSIPPICWWPSDAYASGSDNQQE